MASNNTPTKQTHTRAVQVDEGMAEYIAGLPNPTPSEAEILALHRSTMAEKGKAAAAAAAAATTVGRGRTGAGGPRTGAWPSSAGDVASRLASSGFSDLGTDARWSTLEPAMRERLEGAMLRSEDQWRAYRAQYQREKESPQGFKPNAIDRRGQEQNITVEAHELGRSPLFERQGQQQTSATFWARQRDRDNGAASPTRARVRELLASQREHLLAAVEIDHQLQKIWMKQQAGDNDRV
ncbi:hypothetical protein CSUB01_11208 [Colletotrichum sublineola]|uniref:Uncharacterized protein n=1 Tax=Colletotrichum sublineola TaxID=1173701 RepID=A0A066XKW8_COLSU|nr:hypothetical protein CSUB01_11208 [Colletotrichum sublineola]